MTMKCCHTMVPSILLLLFTTIDAFAPRKNCNHSRSSLTPTTKLYNSVTPTTVGIYYGTVGGDTAKCARYIGNEVDDNGVVEPKGIDEVTVEELLQRDCLIVGAPTWNTGAARERSMTSWDQWLYQTLPTLDLTGKKVAVFGCGDQIHYSFGYCDAVGELYECFIARGCQPCFGQTSTDGYQHTNSKAELEGEGKFVGCLFDEDNQGDLSKARARAWVQQLKEEDFF